MGDPAETVGPARIDVAAATSRGCRATNADAYLIDESAGLFVVADGMGDTPRSAAVARVALEAVREMFLSPWTQRPPAERWASEAAKRLHLGVLQANGRLFVQGHAEPRRTATTFAGAVICREHLCVASVGDSRLYLFRPSTGRLAQLSEDDTILSESLWRGIPFDVAAAQPRAHALTRAIGLRSTIELRPAVTGWEPGDVLLVCTDGVSDALDAAALARCLGGAEALGDMAERVVSEVLVAGGRDNATALLVRRLA